MIKKKSTLSTKLLNISVDLDRVATSLHRGSIAVTERFCQEVLRQKDVSSSQSFPRYIQEILNDLPRVLSPKDSKKKTDDALMYSILLQNFIFRNSHD